MKETNDYAVSGHLGISIVIPCLNESETIVAAVQEARMGIASTNMDGEIIVADNGSQDGSIDLAQKAGARVVHVQSRGYGSALNAGILKAQFEIIVFADADLSYPFTEVPKLVKPILENKADFVLGSRLQGVISPGAMPLLNRIAGTPVLSWLIRKMYYLPCSDCNSGMRAFRKRIYPTLRLRCPGMEYASEMLIRVGQEKMKYSEVPIHFRKDQRSRPPHLKRWRDGWRHLRFILGNASSTLLVALPGLTGVGFLFIALILSFGAVIAPDRPIHFHTAFALVAIAAPLLLFTVTQLLVKSARHGSGMRKSRSIEAIQKWSENSAPFYLAMLAYSLVFLQVIFLFWSWWQADFGNLFEMGGVIRVMVFSIIGTVIFSLDLGMGMLKLIDYEKNRE